MQRVATSETSKASTETRDVVRDSIIIIPADSAWFKAYLKCDSAGNVLIAKLTQQQGRELSQSVNIATENGVTLLQSNCNIDSTAIYLTMRDRYEKTDTSEKESKIVSKKTPFGNKAINIATAVGFGMLLAFLLIFYKNKR